MRRALAPAVAVVALALTGCSGSDEPSATSEETTAASTPADSPGEEGSASPNDDAKDDDSGHDDAIEIEIEGDRIEPNGKVVQATAGEPVTLHVESDRATELHVHSSPEKELAVKKGESMLTLTIDTPGVVDVEDHHTGVVILRLEVR